MSRQAMSLRPLRDPAVWTALAALAAAVAVAPVAARSPTLAVVGVGGLALAGAVALHPRFAAFVLIAATPLIVGIERGSVIPILRPNEALALVLATGLCARLAGEIIAGKSFRPRFGRVDVAILALAVTGSVLPLLWMHARGAEITRDDILYGLTLWKYFGLYLIVRASVRSVRDVGICLWLSLAATSVVALVAILQALQLFGVSDLLATYYAPFGQTRALDDMRGTSTISTPLGVAGVMTFNLAIAAGLIRYGSTRRTLLVGIAILLVFSALASGQFSAAVALLVGTLAFGFITGRLGGVLLAFVPTVIVALVALRPVVDQRLEGFDNAGGIPPSWAGRIENLQAYFWPQLSSGWNWALGVRPSARVEAPLDTGRVWIFIESGYTWLLWTGGIPMLLAFFYFLWTTIGSVSRVARSRTDAIGVAAIASFTALVVTAVLMLFDPHLTLRGVADLSFTLLALALVRDPAWARYDTGDVRRARRQ